MVACEPARCSRALILVEHVVLNPDDPAEARQAVTAQRFGLHPENLVLLHRGQHAVCELADVAHPALFISERVSSAATPPRTVTTTFRQRSTAASLWIASRGGFARPRGLAGRRGSDTSGVSAVGVVRGLRGHRAECARETRPGGGVGMGSREMQDDPADGAHDLHADRDQRLPQPRDLRAAERGAVRAELQLLKQDEGRGRQRDAQLIGPEARATGAPEGEREFQFLEAILAVAAGAIDVGVDPLGRLPQIGDDKARIVARFAPVRATPLPL